MLNPTNLETETITIPLKVSKQEFSYLQALSLLHAKTYDSFDDFLAGITRDFFDDLVFNADNVKNTLLDSEAVLSEFGINKE